MRLSPFAPIDAWRAPAPRADRVGWLGEWAYAHRGAHDGATPENAPSAFAEENRRGCGIYGHLAETIARECLSPLSGPV